MTVFSMHVDLGRVIQGILMEFQNHPPKLNTVVRTNTTLSTPTAVRAGYAELKQPAVSSTTSPFKNSHLVSQFYQLDKLNTSQLEELLKDESKLLEFVEQLPEVIRTEEIKREMVRQNEELARTSLDLKPVMEERKKTLLEKVDEVNALKAEFEVGSELFEVHMKAFHASTLQDNLRVAGQAAEEESETIAQEFLSGKLSTDAFLSQFMKERTLSHMRRAKEEKLHYQLQELHRTGF